MVSKTVDTASLKKNDLTTVTKQNTAATGGNTTDSALVSRTTTTDKPPPFPLKILSMLGIILMNESLCATMLMPFIGLYVARLQGVSPDEAGFASGFLVGVFMFGQVCSGKTWGWFSDVYGRKPAMQMGLLGTGVVMLFFGISPNLPIACLLRFLQGVGNGNLLVAKAMIPEVVPKAHEAKGYSLVSLTWGIGSLIGPVVGGVLYDPTRYESLGLSPTGMFGQYPALLPSLAIACYSFFALACSQFIPESNKDAKKPPSVREALGMGLNKVKKLGGGGGASTQRKHDIDTLTELEGGVDKATDKNAAPKAPKKKAFSFKEAFMLERTRLTLIMYMFISFADIAFLEIMPLWMVASVERGGLGVSSEDVAGVLAASGVIIIISNLTFAKAMGLIGNPGRLWSAGIVIWVAMVVLMPLFAVKSGSPVHYLMAINGIRLIGDAWTFSTVFMLVGKTAPAGQLGAMNGIAQSCGSALRCIAPLVSAPLFAWSISAPHSFPLDENFSFLVMTLPLLITIPIALRLQKLLTAFENTAPSDALASNVQVSDFLMTEQQVTYSSSDSDDDDSIHQRRHQPWTASPSSRAGVTREDDDGDVTLRSVLVPHSQVLGMQDEDRRRHFTPSEMLHPATTPSHHGSLPPLGISPNSNLLLHPSTTTLQHPGGSTPHSGDGSDNAASSSVVRVAASGSRKFAVSGRPSRHHTPHLRPASVVMMVAPGLTHDVLILGERENDNDADDVADSHHIHPVVPVRSAHTSPAHGAADIET